MIELKNLSKAYGELVIFQNLSVTINQGDVIAVIGPSGTGKSTLLNCINLLDPANSGQVIFEGTDYMAPGADLQSYRKKVGMVFQSFNLFGHMTVLENVMNPQIDLLGTSRQEACDRAMEQLHLVGMADKIFSYPSQLSGGQKQRVAIARTLALNPDVILLDEPTSALDPTMVGEVEYVIKRLAAQGRTMLIVTHEIRFAREISNRTFYMDEQGIYEDGPTEEVFTHPKRDKTRRFINRLRSLELPIRSRHFDFIAAIESIEQYGNKYAMSKERIRKAQLLFEEFVMGALLPLSPEATDISVVFEYNEETDALNMTVSHPGESVMDQLPELSRKIIQSIPSALISLTEKCV